MYFRFSWDVCDYYYFPCLTISRSYENFFGIEDFVVDMNDFDEIVIFIAFYHG